MNKIGLLYLSLFYMIFYLDCGAQALNAQDVANGANRDESIKLTGSATKAEDILSISSEVFVGGITDPGIPSYGAGVGWTVYSGVGVNVAENLRGTVDPQTKIGLRTLACPGIQDLAPKGGSSYIFFVYKSTDDSQDPYTAIKLLPATADNVAMVKGLLSK